MVVAYRNDEDVLQARLGSLLEARGAEVASVGDAPRNIYARRVARVVAGSVASLGGLALMLGGLARYVGQQGTFFAVAVQPRSDDGVLSAILAGSVLASALAYLPAHLLAGAAFDRAVARIPSLSGNPRVDLVRLERTNPRRVAGARLGKLEVLSAALPLAAVGLLAPLGLHLFLWLLLSVPTLGGLRLESLEAFDRWIALSVPLVGFAHLVLALLGVRFAHQLGAQSVDEIKAKGPREGWKALLFTSLAGAIPGGVLLLIPPIIVAITGFAIIPISFFAVSRIVVNERKIIEELDT